MFAFWGGGGVSFDPDKDIPSLTGKVILVTGGNIGLGKETIFQLAKHEPAQIWLAARDLDKARDAVADIKKSVPLAPIEVLQLDLSSFDSIKQAAQKLKQSAQSLDLLILNAGVLGAPPGLTAEGYELQFGINQIGHSLLAKLLLPLLLKTAEKPGADVRVIILSSGGHRVPPAGGINFDILKTNGESISTWARYHHSKLANILYTKELAKRYPQLKVVAVHPGVVDTNISHNVLEHDAVIRFLSPILVPLVHFFFKTVPEGAKNQLWAATAADVVSGEYYEPIGVAGTGSDYTRDEELAKKLWDWTEEELKAHSA